MKPNEFMRFYHALLGRFMYRHKGSQTIVDNIFKPMKSVLSSLTKKVVKPCAKKALQSGVSHTGDKLGKKVAKKSGDLIMKQLASRFNKSKTTTMTRPNIYSCQTRGISRHDIM